MSKRKKTHVESSSPTELPAGVKDHSATGAEVGAIAGELAGAVVGSIAGPAGVVAGMIVGAIAGDIAGEVLDADAARRRAHETALDETIGVFGGNLGAARPGSPPARIGAPSAASAGVGGAYGGTVAEGPIQDVDGD
jgi:phage tail tape-measure protein